MFRELLTWINKQAITLDEIWGRSRLRNYHKAIKDEIASMEKAYHEGDVEEHKRHMLRAQGYIKTAVRLVREGKV